MSLYFQKLDKSFSFDKKKKDKSLNPSISKYIYFKTSVYKICQSRINDPFHLCISMTLNYLQYINNKL